MTSECVSGGTKFTAVGTGITLGHSVFAFDMLVKDSFVFGAVRASKTAPESHPFHLLPRHLCFNLTWWQLTFFILNSFKFWSTWLWLSNSLVCDGDWNGHCTHFYWDTLCDRGGMATLQSARVWLPRGFPCSAEIGWNVHMRCTGSPLLLLPPPCSKATAQPW